MLTKYYRKILDEWFDGKGRKFVDFAILEIEKNWNDKNIFVIEAPTGYGKSTISATIALYSSNEELKSIIAFPLRTLLEDQFNKFKRLVNEDVLGKRYMHNPDSRYLIKPISLTTIDTLALTLFGIPPEDLDKVVKYWSGTSSGSLGHYLFSWMSVALSNIVLDEVHLLADSTKSLNFLLALMKIAIDNDQKLVLMSATIPKALEEVLKKGLAPQTDKLHFIKFESRYDEKFVEERTAKKYSIVLNAFKEETKFDKIVEFIEEETEKYSKVIVVFNTVNDAIEFYRKVKNKFNDFDKVLLHSRFNEDDRERKIEKLRNLGEKYIIVSTQVIEAGVDISSNLFITELAPANSLIQRLGRFLRYDGEKEGKIYIWYEVDDSGNLKSYNGKYKVYDLDLSNRTLKKLREIKDEFNVHVAESYGRLLDVYSSEDFKVNERDVHDFIRILMNLESGSLQAVRKFFELEGSFVREGLIIPVISSDVLEKIGDGNEISIDVKKLVKLVVPVSFDVIKKIKPKERIVLRRDKETGDEKLKIEKIEDFELPASRDFLNYLIRNSVIALIVDGNYDAELGLVLNSR